MARKQAGLAILWHMHQPDYRDPETGKPLLPWVRLHAAMNYVAMARMMDEFPKIRHTFNLTPVLTEQLQDLAGGNQDIMMLEARRLEGLGTNERRSLIEQCRMANRKNQIEIYPRYAELIRQIEGEGAGQAADQMPSRDLRDLIGLYHLAWTDEIWFKDFPELNEFRRRGGGFTQEEIAGILDIQMEALKQVIPAYRRLAAEGRAELSTSPYFHPIGPLLIDQSCAREAVPDMKLPRAGFAGRRDLEWQLDEALTAHERTFGAKAAGIWPSEGGISQDFLDLLRSRNLRWTASDDHVLKRSWQAVGREENLGRLTGCYTFNNTSLNIMFRDSLLSDSINFKYRDFPPQAAADDFIASILDSDRSDGSSLKVVILDGENPWNAYPDSGRTFIRALYRAISENPRIDCCQFSEAIERYSSGISIGRVTAGSWINGDFRIWIGHQEDRIAWEWLAHARAALLEEWANIPLERRQRAWRSLMTAEGSDWTWWYGEENPTLQKAAFDRLYRGNISEIYRLAGRPEPGYLARPIQETTG